MRAWPIVGHAYFDRGAASRRFEAERATTLRSRVRTLVVVLSVFWLLQLAFGDAKVFAAAWAIVVLRVVEAVANVALLVALRTPSASLPGLERRTLAWLSAVVVSMGVAVFGARPEFVPMMIGSYFVGMLAFTGFGFRWRTMAAMHALCVLTFLPVGLVLMPAWRLVYVVVVSIFALPFTLLAVSGAFRDRSELAAIDAQLALTATNERLRATEEARSRLFVNLSHDLRTPLAIIRGDAEHLLAAAPNADGARSLQRITRNAETLVELTAQLLELARIDEGRLPQQLANVDVVSLARDICAQLAPPKGVRFVFDGHDVVARADPRHAHRVLANLVGNAVRELRRGGRDGTVEIRASRDERRGAVVVDVIDDGPGVPTDRRAHLFERFAHFDRAGDTGSGIGLALARELAEFDGGSLEYVDSAARTTFRLTLPEATGTADPFPWSSRAPSAPARPVDTTGVRPEHAPRILVVEDWPDMSDVLVRLLSPAFDVETAATVADAVATARAVMPTAVLADVMLPDGNAYDLLQRLRADPELDAVPVVLLSALGEPADQARGLAAGADDYVAKPFSPQELLARLRACIERAATRRRALAEQRRELALELHDGVAGDLARAVVLLGDDATNAPALEGARAAVREGLHEIRSLMWTTTHAPEWRGLVANVRRGLAETCEGAGLELSFASSSDDDETRVPPTVAHALRRITQEWVTNVIRHSGAKKVSCVLVHGDGFVHAHMEDDGRGLDVARPAGHGLAGIARRARALDGHASFSNGDSGGAVIEVALRLMRRPRATGHPERASGD